MDAILADIYYNPEHPASYGSIHKLLEAGKKQIQTLTVHQVKDWLSGQDTYTLHRAVKRKFTHVPTYADHVDSVWQLDTADVRHLATHNDGIKYLLIIIDVLSRFAFVAPMRTKEASRVVHSIKTIQEKYNRKPRVVVSDPGLEFRGNFTKYLKDSNILQYLLRVEQKAPLAERFIRTLKEKMAKYMTHHDTKNYLPAIGEMVRAYNGSIHSRTKMKPVDVNNAKEKKIKQTLYGKYDDWTFNNPKFSEGDLVRQVKKLHGFEKGSTQTTTDEVFHVVNVDFSRPPRILYNLKDLAGEDIKGRFYEEELVLVKTLMDPHQYMKTGKKRVKKTKRKTQTFETFKGYPRKFDIRLKNVPK